MKAREFLDWFLEEINDREQFNKIEVPAEPVQTEEWWWENVGACPPSPIAAGEYLVAIPDGLNTSINNLCSWFNPDIIIETGDGDMYLYKLED